MPTYQYACTSCGERLEAVQKFSDEPLTECPVCGGTLRKVFSAVGVVFKGSGFYKTDSRSSKSSTSSSSGAAAGEAAASSSPSTEPTPKKGDSAGETKSTSGDKKSGSGDKVA